MYLNDTHYKGLDLFLYRLMSRYYHSIPKWIRIRMLNHFRNVLTRKFLSIGTEEERNVLARDIKLLSINIDVLKNGGYYR